MPFDPNQFEDEAMNDPGALIGAIVVLGILAVIILAVLWRDDRREASRRAFEPIVTHETR